MSASQDDDASGRNVDLLARLLRLHDLDMLLDAFSQGQIDRTQLTKESASNFQRNIGSFIRALAEHDPGAAQDVGQVLRDRIDEFLGGLERRTGAIAVSPARSEGFKDRDDSVLLREFVVLTALTRTNDAIRSAEIFKLIRLFDAKVQDQAITAHLARMLKAGLAEKLRKGRYSAVPASADHLGALTREIEARGLALPTVPRLDD